MTKTSKSRFLQNSRGCLWSIVGLSVSIVLEVLCYGLFGKAPGWFLILGLLGLFFGFGHDTKFGGKSGPWG